MNMNIIPKASDARIEALKNPSFERKVELYNSVVEKIKEASSKGQRQFTVSEAEYYALHEEILQKSYKEHDGTIIGKMTADFSNFIVSAVDSSDVSYKTYYFN